MFTAESGSKLVSVAYPFYSTGRQFAQNLIMPTDFRERLALESVGLRCIIVYIDTTHDVLFVASDVSV